MKVKEPQSGLDYILFSLSKTANFRERETDQERMVQE
jgi:hypothetical protein